MRPFVVSASWRVPSLVVVRANLQSRCRRFKAVHAQQRSDSQPIMVGSHWPFWDQRIGCFYPNAAAGRCGPLLSSSPVPSPGTDKR